MRALDVISGQRMCVFAQYSPLISYLLTALTDISILFFIKINK